MYRMPGSAILKMAKRQAVPVLLLQNSVFAVKVRVYVNAENVLYVPRRGLSHKVVIVRAGSAAGVYESLPHRRLAAVNHIAERGVRGLCYHFIREA